MQTDCSYAVSNGSNNSVFLLTTRKKPINCLLGAEQNGRAIEIGIEIEGEVRCENNLHSDGIRFSIFVFYSQKKVNLLRHFN